MAIGMFFLNFSSPINFQPFILISLFMSLALIPILLTKKKAPTFKKISGMSLKELYKVSPLGMVGSIFYGTAQSALFSLIPVYAASMNFSILEISIVTFLVAISGAISQWPIGKISDNMDRRRVIIYTTFAAAFLHFVQFFLVEQCFMTEYLDQAKHGFIFQLFYLPLQVYLCLQLSLLIPMILFQKKSLLQQGLHYNLHLV
jgi:predicted MFS family arabinose efflux permease